MVSIVPGYALSTRWDTLQIEDVIEDIYHQVSEDGEEDWSQVEEDLREAALHPINLNTARAEDLERLHLLTAEQIDNILLHVYQHPMDSLYELRMISGLRDWEIRDMLPFVCVQPPSQEEQAYTRNMWQHLKHEITTRIDVRDMEHYEQDPVYLHARYKMQYRDLLYAGIHLKRSPGEQQVSDGAYVELNRLSPHLQTLCVGDMQAQWGQGLVLAGPYHMGKNRYMSQVGLSRRALRHCSYTEANLHGVGATVGWQRGKTSVHTTALYSLQRTQDSIWHNTLGAHVQVRHRQLEVGVSAIENLYTDSVYPTRNAAYNQHYFRGHRQAVIGANVRWVRQWLNLYGEVAVCQNQQWGVATEWGCHLTPLKRLRLTALVRYYSPWWDNVKGYGFSENSRNNDEHGVYIGWDAQLNDRWQWQGWGDVFCFSGPKYGIPQYPTWGWDIQQQWQFRPAAPWNMLWRIRARQKGSEYALYGRYSTRWSRGGWQLMSQADCHLTPSGNACGWGVVLSQDLTYSWQTVPLRLNARIQLFDIADWSERIYLYERDVLYGMSTPALYGRGGRMYINLRWQIIEQLAMYVRLSETIYQKKWAEAHSKSITNTDLHVMLRAVF